MATSLFCEHKKLRSTCFVCGSTIAGPTPALGPSAHDPDETWHALRAECASRAARMIRRAWEDSWSAEAYHEIYTKPARQVKTLSEEEDVSTFTGAFYLAMVKLFDVSVEGKRIQGYNGLSDWDEMRDYVFRKYSPAELATAIKVDRLRIHGGNAAWPRQQIASDLVRSSRLEEAVMAVAFGTTGETPDKIDEAECKRRLEAVERIATEEGIAIGTLGFASRILHIFDAKRWPALSNRVSPEVAATLDVDAPAVETPADYLALTEVLRKYAKAEGHVDLDATDIAFSNAFEAMQDDELDEIDLDAP